MEVLLKCAKGLPLIWFDDGGPRREPLFFLLFFKEKEKALAQRKQQLKSKTGADCDALLLLSLCGSDWMI